MTGKSERHHGRGLAVALALVVVGVTGLFLVGDDSDSANLAAERPLAVDTTTASTEATDTEAVPSRTGADVDGDGQPDPLSFKFLTHAAGYTETRLVAELSQFGHQEASISAAPREPLPTVAAVVDMDGDGAREVLVGQANPIGARYFTVLRLADGKLGEVAAYDQPLGLMSGRGSDPHGQGLTWVGGFECRESASSHAGSELIQKRAVNDDPNDGGMTGGDTMYGTIWTSYFEGHERVLVQEAHREERFSVHDEAKLAEYARTECGSFTG